MPDLVYAKDSYLIQTDKTSQGLVNSAVLLRGTGYEQLGLALSMSLFARFELETKSAMDRSMESGTSGVEPIRAIVKVGDFGVVVFCFGDCLFNR